MDGVPEIELSPTIKQGSYFDYYFNIPNPPGTHMYHTHVNSAIQQMMGLGGAFIILDKNHREKIEKDYFLMMGEFITASDGNLLPLHGRPIKNTNYPCYFNFNTI